MKKVSLLLAVLLVLTCCLLAACGGEEGASSSADSTPANTSTSASSAEETSSEAPSASSSAVEDESSVVEDESSAVEESSTIDESSADETTSDESSAAESSVEESSTPETSEPAGNEPSGDNLALGKSYTGGDPSTVAGYTARLTDGNAAESLNYDDTWFAFYHNPDADPALFNAPDGVGVVIIDLEQVASINSVRVNTFLGNTSGILAPKSMKVEVSEDGSSYEQIDDTKTFTAAEGDTTVSWVEFKANGASGRYVKLTFELNSVWGFLNEIEVY